MLLNNVVKLICYHISYVLGPISHAYFFVTLQNGLTINERQCSSIDFPWTDFNRPMFFYVQVYSGVINLFDLVECVKTFASLFFFYYFSTLHFP